LSGCQDGGIIEDPDPDREELPTDTPTATGTDTETATPKEPEWAVRRSGWGTRGLGGGEKVSSCRASMYTTQGWQPFDTDRDAIRVVDVESDQQITMQYEQSDATFELEYLTPYPYFNDVGVESGEIVEPLIGTRTTEASYEFKDATVEGDRTMFEDTVLSSYRFEIVVDEEVVAQTSPVELVTGYTYEARATDSEIWVERGEIIQPDWTVQFRLVPAEGDPDDTAALLDVPNRAGSDRLSVPIDRLDVASGRYEAHFDVYIDPEEPKLLGLTPVGEVEV
jgi:hypothetical protein